MLKNWLLSLISIVLLLGLLQVLLPEGKTKKIIQMLFSFVMLLHILQPIKYLSEFDLIDFLSDIVK